MQHCKSLKLWNLTQKYSNSAIKISAKYASQEFLFENKLAISARTIKQYARTKLEDFLLAMNESLEEVLPLLSPVVDEEILENDFSDKLPPGGRTVLLSSFFVRIINKITKLKHMAILFDDVHLFDSASIRILYLVCSRCTNLSIILASRPCSGRIKQVIDDISECEYSSRFKLDGWTKMEIVKFMRGQFYCGSSLLGPDVIDLVWRETKGVFCLT